MRSSSTLAGAIARGWRLLSIRATAPSLCSIAARAYSVLTYTCRGLVRSNDTWNFRVEYAARYRA
jgi:hypothetical protein